MKRKALILIVAAVFAVGLVVTPTYIYTNQAAPPAGFSGAPGESSCAASGCHNQNSVKINSPDIVLSSLGSVNNISGGYTPGVTYDLLLTVNPNTSTTGFQLTVLDDNNMNAGTLMPVANSRTQLSTGSNAREYLGHLNAGQKNFWNFKWKAPSTDIPVKFYIASLVGTGNSSEDIVKMVRYSATTSSFGPLSVGINEPVSADNHPHISVYPNPVLEKFRVDYFIENKAAVKMDVFSLEGRLVKELYAGVENQGNHFQAFDFENALTGLHLLKIQIGETVFYKKMMFGN